MFKRLLLMLPTFVVAALFILLTGDCTGRTDSSSAVPRRTAYPRIEFYDSVYRPVSLTLPVRIMVNDSTTVDIASHGDAATWIDVRYPRYGATLRLTLSRLEGDSLFTAIANRRERIALNAGGLRSTVTELTAPNGLSSEIVATPGAMVTPLQIIATDSTGLLFTGALEMPPALPGNDAEYYMPIVEGVERDLIHMAKNLTAE